MWLWVIRKAQEDAEQSDFSTAGVLHKRYLARRWLTVYTRDLAFVCEFAGLNAAMRDRLIRESREKYGKHKKRDNDVSSDAVSNAPAGGSEQTSDTIGGE